MYHAEVPSTKGKKKSRVPARQSKKSGPSQDEDPGHRYAYFTSLINGLVVWVDVPPLLRYLLPLGTAHTCSNMLILLPW